MLSKKIPPCSERNKATHPGGSAPESEAPGRVRAWSALPSGRGSAGHQGGQGTRRAPPLPGLTGLGGGFDIALPGAAEPQDHAGKPNRTPRQPTLGGGGPKFLFAGFTAARLQGPAPTLDCRTSGRRQSRSAQYPAPPRGRQSLPSAQPGDEEVAAVSPSANWLLGWQLRRGGSAGGAHGGARGGGGGTGRSRGRAPQARAGAGPAARAPDERWPDPAGARARGATVAGAPPRLAPPHRGWSLHGVRPGRDRSLGWRPLPGPPPPG